MEQPILAENQRKRLTIKAPLLICFAMFAVWQMGIIYFSGTALSISGRTPIPVSVGNVTILIVIGYIATISFIYFLPRFSVQAERIAATLALCSGALLFIPLPGNVLVWVCYFHFFCCVFMIGLESSIIINLFTEETAVLHFSLAYAVANCIIAVIQNDVIPVSFSGFRLVIVVSLLMMLLFFWKLPANVWPRTVRKADNMVFPRRVFAGIYVLGFFGSALTLFGVSVAERVVHGVSVLYVSAGFCGLLIFFLWKRFHIQPLRIISVMVVIAAAGVVMAIVSLYFPSHSIWACVLLGPGNTILYSSPLMGILMAKQYPSKVIAPALIMAAFLPIVLHTTLLEALRDNLQIFYIIYLAVSVGVVILYLKLEPSLIYSFRASALVPVQSGKDVFPENIKSEPVVSKAAGLAAQAFDNLSGQEIRLAELIMQGYGNSEMAEILHITGNTVKGYRKTLYSKLQIHSRRELFELAERN